MGCSAAYAAFAAKRRVSGSVCFLLSVRCRGGHDHASFSFRYRRKAKEEGKRKKRRGRKKTGVRAPARVYIYTRAARLSPQKVGRSDARKIADRVKAVVESLFARVMSRPAVRLGKKKDVAKTRTEQRQWSISVRASLSLSKNRSWSLSRTARLASWRASLSLKFFFVAL